MKRSRIATAVPLALIAGAVAFSAPAQADSTTDAFLAAVQNAGVAGQDPANAIAVGQSVCPMLSQPGQTAADVAAKVADAAGMSLGPATMFTGIAISMFCPSVVSSIGNGSLPIPLSMLGL